MTTTLQRPRGTSTITGPGHPDTDARELTDGEVLAHVEQRSTTDRAAERHRQAKELAALADGDRHVLEDLRARYLRRLHRSSTDFDATEGLRTVELALSMTPRPEGLYAWQRRERDRPRRWWRRRRRPR